MQLDRSKPYGYTLGPDYQYYDQDGRQYRMDGSPMEGGNDDIVASPPDAKPVPKPRPAKSSPSSEFADLPSDELKVLVEINGGQWLGRIAAIKFLSES